MPDLAFALEQVDLVLVLFLAPPAAQHLDGDDACRCAGPRPGRPGRSCQRLSCTGCGSRRGNSLGVTLEELGGLPGCEPALASMTRRNPPRDRSAVQFLPGLLNLVMSDQAEADCLLGHGGTVKIGHLRRCAHEALITNDIRAPAETSSHRLRKFMFSTTYPFYLTFHCCQAEVVSAFFAISHNRIDLAAWAGIRYST